MSYDMRLSQAVRVCTQANGGKAFIRPTITNGTLLAALRALAVEAGLDRYTARELTDDELCALYATARKTGSGTRALAAKLAKRYGAPAVSSPGDDMPDDNPFFGDAPTPAPTPAPIPTQVIGLSAAALDRALRPVNEAILGLRRDDTRLALSFNKLEADFAAYREVLKTDIPALIAEALKSQTPTHLVVTMPDSAPVTVGIVHKATPDILSLLSMGLNVYLYGPAGSGKTTAARKCAEALGVAFHATGKLDHEAYLLGYNDASGKVVRTPFREAYEHGGLFLFDELDRSDERAVSAMNMALANGLCAFPDKTVERHPSFYCIAAGNTTMSGATEEYSTANKMDEASIDRFCFLEFGYDEALETALATNPDWCRFVQSARRAVTERSLPKLITPRATLDGCIQLAGGRTWEQVERSVLWKGLHTATVEQIKSAMDFTPAQGS